MAESVTVPLPVRGQLLMTAVAGDGGDLYLYL